MAYAYAVFGKFIDHRLEVIGGSDDANSVDGASEHFRIVIQDPHNAMQSRRISPYELDVEQGQAVRSDHQDVLGGDIRARRKGGALGFIQTHEDPDPDETRNEYQGMNDRG